MIAPPPGKIFRPAGVSGPHRALATAAGLHRLRLHRVTSTRERRNFIEVLHRANSQLAADTRTTTARLRRHTALQYSTRSHSRADLRLNLMGSPQSLHAFTAEFPRFSVTTLLFISDIRLRVPWIRERRIRFLDI